MFHRPSTEALYLPADAGSRETELGSERSAELDDVLAAMPLGDEAKSDSFTKAGSAKHLTEDFDGAIWEFTKAVLVKPDGFDAYVNRGVSCQDQKKWAKALADFRLAAKLNPDDAATWNNIAAIQATCPDENFRDGQQAVENAKRACQLTESKSWACMDTLAAAYAEIGDFEAAA